MNIPTLPIDISQKAVRLTEDLTPYLRLRARRTRRIRSSRGMTMTMT